METWCFLGILFSLPHNKADVYLRAALSMKFFIGGATSPLNRVPSLSSPMVLRLTPGMLHYG